MKLELPDWEATNQTRTVGMPLAKNDFDTIVLDPFTKMESNPAKLHRCVDKIKNKSGVDNPWAICNASIGKS